MALMRRSGRSGLPRKTKDNRQENVDLCPYTRKEPVRQIKIWLNVHVYTLTSFLR